MKGTISLDGLLTLLNGMSLSDRRWLSDRLIEQMRIEEMKTKSTRIEDKKERDNIRLDNALAKFHEDWGGDAEAIEIAENLRSGKTKKELSSILTEFQA